MLGCCTDLKCSFSVKIWRPSAVLRWDYGRQERHSQTCCVSKSSIFINRKKDRFLYVQPNAWCHVRLFLQRTKTILTCPGEILKYTCPSRDVPGSVSSMKGEKEKERVCGRVSTLISDPRRRQEESKLNTFFFIKKNRTAMLIWNCLKGTGS